MTNGFHGHGTLQVVKPFLPGGLINRYKLDELIFSVKGCLVSFILITFI